MNNLTLPGLSVAGRLVSAPARNEYVQVQRPLRRVLAFLGHSIDAVCNDPIVKNEVRGYYKLHLMVQRSMEITELERWWNGESI